MMDHAYGDGTVISAKEFPARKLRIRKYYRRIYYCTVVNESFQKELAYFEHELLPPQTGVAPPA